MDVGILSILFSASRRINSSKPRSFRVCGTEPLIEFHLKSTVTVLEVVIAKKSSEIDPDSLFLWRYNSEIFSELLNDGIEPVIPPPLGA